MIYVKIQVFKLRFTDLFITIYNKTKKLSRQNFYVLIIRGMVEGIPFLPRVQNKETIVSLP